MKKVLFISLAIAAFTFTGCTQNATPTPMDTGNSQGTRQVQGGIGNAPRDDEPVSERDKNNTHFKDGLKAPAAFPETDISAEHVWKWVQQVELNYLEGMLSQQQSISEEQRALVDKWLSDFYGDELKHKRLLRDLTPVQGGYRIRSGYDFHPSDSMIQNIDKMDLSRSNTRMVLNMNLTVEKDQKINVIYTVDKEQGKWRIVDYSFKLIP